MTPELLSMHRSDWLLLVLEAAGGDALSPVQLQKTLFLIQKNLPKATAEEFYEFRPYNYGPFDAEIYMDAKQLASEGLVSIDKTSPNGFPLYSITDAGKAEAQVASSRTSETARRFVTDVVEWAKPLSFQQLVRSIYKAYPEQRINSVFNS